MYSPGVIVAAVPDDGDQVAVPTDFDAQDAEAGLLAMERHALDRTGQVFCGMRRGEGGAKVAIESSRAYRGGRSRNSRGR